MRGSNKRHALYSQLFDDESEQTTHGTCSFEFGAPNLTPCRESLPIVFKPQDSTKSYARYATSTIRVRKLEVFVRFSRLEINKTSANIQIAATGSYKPQFDGDLLTVALVRMPGKSNTYSSIPSRSLLWGTSNEKGDCYWGTNPLYFERLQILAIQSVNVAAVRCHPTWIDASTETGGESFTRAAFVTGDLSFPAVTTTEYNAGVATGMTYVRAAFTVPGIEFPEVVHDGNHACWESNQTRNELPDPIYLSHECDYLEDIDPATVTFLNHDYMALICGTWTQAPAPGEQPPAFRAYCSFRLTQEP